jgi:hypothetical protein
VLEQVQMIRRRVAENPAELVGPLLAAGRNDHTRPGAQERADDAFAYRAAATRDENSPIRHNNSLVKPMLVSPTYHHTLVTPTKSVE